MASQKQPDDLTVKGIGQDNEPPKTPKPNANGHMLTETVWKAWPEI